MSETRRQLLGVRVVVVSFGAAVQSINALVPDRDERILRLEQARDRALMLLDATAGKLSGSDAPLKDVIGEARRRIESESLVLH